MFRCGGGTPIQPGEPGREVFPVQPEGEVGWGRVGLGAPSSSCGAGLGVGYLPIILHMQAVINTCATLTSGFQSAAVEDPLHPLGRNFFISMQFLEKAAQILDWHALYNLN